MELGGRRFRRADGGLRRQLLAARHPRQPPRRHGRFPARQPVLPDPLGGRRRGQPALAVRFRFLDRAGHHPPPADGHVLPGLRRLYPAGPAGRAARVAHAAGHDRLRAVGAGRMALLPATQCHATGFRPGDDEHPQRLSRSRAGPRPQRKPALLWRGRRAGAGARLLDHLAPAICAAGHLSGVIGIGLAFGRAAADDRRGPPARCRLEVDRALWPGLPGQLRFRHEPAGAVHHGLPARAAAGRWAAGRNWAVRFAGIGELPAPPANRVYGSTGGGAVPARPRPATGAQRPARLIARV